MVMVVIITTTTTTTTTEECGGGHHGECHQVDPYPYPHMREKEVPLSPSYPCLEEGGEEEGGGAS